MQPPILYVNLYENLARGSMQPPSRILNQSFSNSPKLDDSTNDIHDMNEFTAYLLRLVSELDCSPAEILENHHFSAEIAILRYDTVCLYVCRGQKFSSALGEQYMTGILSSSAFQRGAVHVVQMAFGHQSHPPCAACRIGGCMHAPPGGCKQPPIRSRH